MIIDRSRETESPENGAFRLLFCFHRNGKIFLIEKRA